MTCGGLWWVEVICRAICCLSLQLSFHWYISCFQPPLNVNFLWNSALTHVYDCNRCEMHSGNIWEKN